MPGSPIVHLVSVRSQLDNYIEPRLMGSSSVGVLRKALSMEKVCRQTARIGVSRASAVLLTCEPGALPV